MNLPLQFARLVMRVAVIAAPSKHSVWIRAMTGEFSAIEDSIAAFRWSLGCLFIAIVWRVRGETAYILALAVAPFAMYWFLRVFGPPTWAFVFAGSFKPPALDSSAFPDIAAIWVATLTTTLNVGMAIVAFVLCRRWCGRTLFTGLAVWIIAPASGASLYHTLQYLSAPFEWRHNHPPIPNLLMLIWGSAQMMSPTMIGAVSAWAVERRLWLLLGLCGGALVGVAFDTFLFFLSEKFGIVRPALGWLVVMILLFGGYISLRGAIRRKYRDFRTSS